MKLDDLPISPIPLPLKPEQLWIREELQDEYKGKEEWIFHVGVPHNYEERLSEGWTPLRRLQSAIEDSGVFFILYGRENEFERVVEGRPAACCAAPGEGTTG